MRQIYYTNAVPSVLGDFDTHRAALAVYGSFFFWRRLPSPLCMLFSPLMDSLLFAIQTHHEAWHIGRPDSRIVAVEKRRSRGWRWKNTQIGKWLSASLYMQRRSQIHHALSFKPLDAKSLLVPENHLTSFPLTRRKLLQMHQDLDLILASTIKRAWSWIFPRARTGNGTRPAHDFCTRSDFCSEICTVYRRHLMVSSFRGIISRCRRLGEVKSECMPG